MRISVFALASALLACALPARAEEDCRLNRVTSVDMGIDAHGGVTVPMNVSSRDVTLLIDTGGVDSMLTQSVVSEMKLTQRPIGNMRVTMYGGEPIFSFVRVDEVTFGGLAASDMTFLVMPNDRAEQIDGTLAPDVLRAYDDDFDFANARFSLFSPKHCPGEVVYWTHDPYTQIGIDVDEFGHVNLPVLLDGKEVRFDLDTGSSRSTLNLETAEALFGFDKSSPALKVVESHGSQAIYRYPFKTLTFGGVAVFNPDITLVPREISHMRDTGGILGMGVLRQLHLYISYKESKIYVTSATAH